MNKSNKIDANALLKNNGFKITNLRLTLLEVLISNKTPLDVKSIQKKVRKLKADPATIYRALSAFEEAGIIRSLSLEKDKSSYEFIHSNSHDHYIICQTCGLVEAIPYCIRNISKSAIKKSKKFKVIFAHRMEFFGSCKSCVRTVRY